MEFSKKLRAFVELIKFEHTVFALPFAYLGMLLSAKTIPAFGKFFWITAAMVSARTAGMTLNRLVDLEIDRKNPRTKDRPLITGDFSLLGSDGLHPNAAGYQRIADTFFGVIKQTLELPPTSSPTGWMPFFAVPRWR